MTVKNQRCLIAKKVAGEISNKTAYLNAKKSVYKSVTHRKRQVHEIHQTVQKQNKPICTLRLPIIDVKAKGNEDLITVDRSGQVKADIRSTRPF